MATATAAEHAGVAPVELSLELHPPPGRGSPMTFKLMSSELVQAVKQCVIDMPGCSLLTCFHLEVNGERLTDFVELCTIDALMAAAGSTTKVQLVPDEYSFRSFLVHLQRFRDAFCFDEMKQMFAGADNRSISFLRYLCKGEDGKGPQDKTSALDDELEKYDDGKLDLAFSPIQTVETPHAIRSIALSGWHPPPAYRQLVGDLGYLQVEVLERRTHHVTVCAEGFYVNKSTATEFDPEAAGKAKVFHELVDLISHLSSKFTAESKKLEQLKLEKHPIDTFPSPYKVVPWLGQPVPHHFDVCRSQMDHRLNVPGDMDELLSLGQCRDWHDELQSLREWPQDTEAEFTVFNRTLFKFSCDFVAAAEEGAVAVVRGNVPPLNPMEDRAAHLFLHNNMFFTFALDGRGQHKDVGGDEAAHSTAAKDLNSIRVIDNLGLKGVNTVATVIVDVFGYRVVVQSVIPGIMKRGQQSIFVYGRFEADEPLQLDKEVDSVYRQLADKLHIAPHTVQDCTGSKITVHSSVESKGTRSADGVVCILDVHRTTPPDFLFGDGGNDVRHKSYVFRHELVGAFCQGDNADVRFNPDVGLAGVVSVDNAEQQEQDAQRIRQLHSFLMDRVIPDLVESLCTLQTTVLDGVQLRDVMHERGINMRYLGHITKLLLQHDPPAPQYIVRLCIGELIARSAKHALRKYLRQCALRLHGSLVAHFLNCLLSDFVGKSSAPLGPSCKISSGKLWATVKQTVWSHFRFHLPEDPLHVYGIQKSQLLRSLCLKLGIQLRARRYDMENTKAAAFKPQDILMLRPVVKHTAPGAAHIKQEDAQLLAMIETNRGKGDQAKVCSKADSILQRRAQLYGPLHEHVATCYRVLGTMLQESNPRTAVDFRERTVLVCERVYGFDHGETVQALVALAQSLHRIGNVDDALRCLRHARILVKINHGDCHPLLVSIDNTSALIMLTQGRTSAAVSMLESTVDACDKTPACAMSFQLMSKAANTNGDVQQALAFEKKAYSMLSQQLGREHALTQKCYATVKQLTAKVVAAAQVSAN